MLNILLLPIVFYMKFFESQYNLEFHLYDQDI